MSFEPSSHTDISSGITVMEEYFFIYFFSFFLTLFTDQIFFLHDKSIYKLVKLIQATSQFSTKYSYEDLRQNTG